MGDNCDGCHSLSCKNGQVKSCNNEVNPKWANKGVVCRLVDSDDSKQKITNETQDLIENNICYDFFKTLVKHVNEKSQMSISQENFFKLSSNSYNTSGFLWACEADENSYPVGISISGPNLKGGMIFCLPKYSCPVSEFKKFVKMTQINLQSYHEIKLEISKEGNMTDIAKDDAKVVIHQKIGRAWFYVLLA